METETETYEAMLSLDEKSYILYKDGKMKIHGSSLKGKQMPIVCDEFRDTLCMALFKNEDPLKVFHDFQNLSRFEVHDFQIRVYSTKMDYHKNSLYDKLLQKLAVQGIRVAAGSSLEYVKTVNGYMPIVLLSSDDAIDYAYYKRRLAEVASRILFKPAKSLLKLLGSGQKNLEEFE
jgi:DNA polymerase elongation subunit (family B)